LLDGELRIGLKEAQVEAAAARAFGRPLGAVRHANLLRGDIGQAHVGDDVRLFSRTLDEITHGYPDVVASLRGLGNGLVLDGELLAVDPEQPGRARPLQRFSVG
jgi:DNA ligase-1